MMPVVAVRSGIGDKKGGQRLAGRLLSWSKSETIMPWTTTMGIDSAEEFGRILGRYF